MSRSRILFLSLSLPAALIAAVLAAGCSDSTSPTPSTALLTGSVTDLAGNPIEGAALLVGFRASFADLLQPEKGQPDVADLPPGQEVLWIKITDACGDTIRTLCEGDCQGEPGVILWNGLDDAGLRVVEGVYYYSLATADTLVGAKMVLIHDYHDWNTTDCRAHAVTDAGGVFRLGGECLGFGTVITCLDEEGNFQDERPVTRMVNLRVICPDGRWVRRDSVLFPEEGTLTEDFVLPEP